mmetsp:Transcript_27054/g.68441  ORF Transcript_27054/g.68441 Transcript_27054/m.68441 type:complete len:238 (-) Transcript_27054:112-825(-)
MQRACSTVCIIESSFKFFPPKRSNSSASTTAHLSIAAWPVKCKICEARPPGKSFIVTARDEKRPLAPSTAPNAAFASSDPRHEAVSTSSAPLSSTTRANSRIQFSSTPNALGTASRPAAFDSAPAFDFARLASTPSTEKKRTHGGSSLLAAFALLPPPSCVCSQAATVRSVSAGMRISSGGCCARRRASSAASPGLFFEISGHSLDSASGGSKFCVTAIARPEGTVFSTQCHQPAGT